MKSRMTGDQSDIDKIEQQLRSSYKPIHPRTDYINTLHLRLTDPTQLQVTINRNGPVHLILLGIVGVISISLIGITTIRLFLSLLGILGLFRYTKLQKLA
jgi:hypothetical protein